MCVCVCVRARARALQRRQPFTVWSLLKSPVGIMAVFTLVGVFILPRLMGEGRKGGGRMEEEGLILPRLMGGL